MIFMKRGTVLRTKNILQYVLALIAGLCMPLNITHAQTAQVPEQVDSNFVIASIIIADPGDVLYSTVGHVGIHMQCPEHNLDYVFSYESEDARSKVLRFLSGKLRMGLAAIPYQEYLDMFRPEGRGVKEYTLYLPIEVKRNLWRVLDNHLMEGMDLPFDYIKRGCANSTLKLLMEGMDTLKISFGKWPQKFNMTRRELTEIQMKDVPWTWCFMNLICNGQIDAPCSKIDKVIMPADLIEVLKDATVQGKPLMQKEPATLLPDNHIVKPCLFTPFVLSILVLLLTILCAVYRSGIMDYTLLAVQTILGLITIYLVFFSTLPCTEWSWLIIPFNPLPLIFWKWRQKWCMPYAFVILIWALVMLLWPHHLTDNTYIVLSVALAVSYANIYRLSKMSNRKQK